MTFRILLVLAALAVAGCSDKSPEPAQTSASPVEAPPAMASAAAPPAPSANASMAEIELPRRFSATGTEPFWGADVDGTALTYRTPEYPEGMKIAVTRKEAAGTISFSGTIDGKPLELAISAGPCSDGMSDKVYRWTATRTIGPDIERGCAG